MIVSTRIRYGLRAMTEIASKSDEEGVLQKDISVSQEISNKYLDHIIRDLKSAELICNRKQKKSGYRLCKPASEISVYMIYRAFEPELCLVECLGGYACPRKAECSTQPVWREMNKRITDFLKSVSLQDILDGKDMSIIDKLPSL